MQALAPCQGDDEGLTLKMAALETHYGGQFPLATQSIKPNYLVICLAARFKDGSS